MDDFRITIKYKGRKADRLDLTGTTMSSLPLDLLQRDLLALRLNYPKREDVCLPEAGAISFIRRLNDRDKVSNVNRYCESVEAF
jgi:hypothetical protein